MRARTEFRCAALWMAMVALTLVGCAGGSSLPAPPVAPTAVPAGVDTVAAQHADSLADVSFVDAPAEDEALSLQEGARLIVEQTDSIWLIMAALSDSGRAVTEADSMEATGAATEGGLALVELDSLLRQSDLDVEALGKRTAELLDSAEIALERSFQLNPFDTRTRTWLAQVYGLQARRLGQAESYHRAIDELEKLLWLTPDQHTAYAMLANNYFYASEWDGAALNYQHAERVYLETFDLVVDAAPVLDSAVVFSYIQAQGDMHVQRFDATGAREAYERALPFASSTADSVYIAGELEWMAWDDMNIRSAVARDSLLALEQRGELDDARRGYERLLTGLTAQSAIDETDWRLAIVDYNVGNTEEAAERLRALVARTPVDARGVPLDPAYAQYFADYGTLCMNLGRTFRVEQRDRRTALKFFTQATMVKWSGQALAHFEVARLVQGNVAASLESATAALHGESSLSDDQRLDLYRLLMELSRRSGDFDKARVYRDAYRELRGG